MARPCDDISSFMEGQLSSQRAERFRQHLPDCAHCQRRFADLLQHELLADAPVTRAEEQRLPPPPPRRMPRALAATALGAGLMALVLTVGTFVARRVSTHSEDVWLAQSPTRSLSARLSHPGAERHRPLSDRTLGSPPASEELPYAALAELKDDRQGQAAAFLVRNDPGEAQRALSILAPLGNSPEVNSDRAAALLLGQKPEESLAMADVALSLRPGYAPALWNRALALEELGMPWFAAESFEDVAKQGEPGWAAEARDRARRLRDQANASKTRWEEIPKKIAQLGQSGVSPALSELSQAPSARLHFYIAVWSAPTREQVERLLPLARELDKRASGRTLETYVERVAKSKFELRGPLVNDYAALLGASLANPAQDEVIARIQASRGNEDLLVGVLLRLDATERHLEAFARAARTLEDPWFDLLVEQERAKAEKARGQFVQAAHILRVAHEKCPLPGLEFRCLWLELELSNLFLQNDQAEEAQDSAMRGWRKARQANEWWLEGSMLWNLAQAARYMNNAPLARARYGEYLARDTQKTADTVRRVHQHLSEVAFHELRVDEARRELDTALATELPLSFSGAFSLADLSRLSREPEDEAQLERALKSAEPRMTPGTRVLATHVRGRFWIARDPLRGRELLWRTIEESKAPELTTDPQAARARTYSYTSLLMDAGQRDAFTQVFEWSEQEYGLTLPRTCLLLASADSERTLFLVRGASGQVVGHYDESRRQPLPMDLEGVVPEKLLSALSACAQVEVFARPPLHGRRGMLPSSMAWSYLMRKTIERPSPRIQRRHLAVHAVDAPREYGLPRLNPWEPSFSSQEIRVELTGAEATPERVLTEMSEATEIDLMVHGNNGGSLQASSLVLARGNHGAELNARDVQAASLKGAPFTVLAACRAAAMAYSTQTPLSLPAAFMKAGARGVLAATEEIPDREAMAVFTAIRERIRQGDSPAIALRDERQRWQSTHPHSTWINSVLLFE